MRVGLAVAVAILLGGCLDHMGRPEVVEAWSEAQDVVLTAQVHEVRGGFLANLTAHNVGDHTYWLRHESCGYRGEPPWSAELYDGAGNATWYWGPDRLGQQPCQGDMTPFGPGAWENWTATSLDCPWYGVCDNVWDGRLWSGSNASDVHWKVAPPGAYTWTFTFRYQESAMACSSRCGMGVNETKAAVSARVVVDR
jgi:hypothetical protein